MQLPHSQGVRRLVIVRPCHPVGFDLWLNRYDQMITRPQPLATTKVGTAPARPLLFEDGIHAAFLQVTQQKVGGVIGVPQQDVARIQRIEQRSEQGLFITAFAPVLADGRIEHRPASQARMPTIRHSGKPNSGCWLRGCG